MIRLRLWCSRRLIVWEGREAIRGRARGLTHENLSSEGRLIRAAEELPVRSRQATVSMGLIARLASAKLTLLSGIGTTSWATNR